MLRNYLLISFFLANAALSYILLLPWGRAWLFPSFLANLACIVIGLGLCLRGNRLNLDTIVWIFVYMFFFLAPVIQLGSGSMFPNTMPIAAQDVLRANFILLIWHVLYLIFRSNYSQSADTQGRPPRRPIKLAEARTRQLYFVLAAAIFGAVFMKLGFQYFLGHVELASLGLDKSMTLLVTIGSQGIALANWLFAFERRRETRDLKAAAYLLLSSAMLIYFVSPFNTSRFYLGFTVILIVYLFYAHRLTPGKFVWVILSGLFLVFPLLNFFRYGWKDFAMPSIYHLMFDQLMELHFDAYANLIATLHYTAEFGLAYGYRLLGVLLFFVPRSLWPGKPLSSGEAIGDYISANYALNMSNLSNPLPSEFYLNFGMPGVVVGAICAARFVRKLELAQSSKPYVHALIAGYMFIIYRGDLMNAFAYCFGTYVIMVLGPQLIERWFPAPERTENRAMLRRI